MNAVDTFANVAQTTITAGGTTAPVAGTQEQWVPQSASGFPLASPVASPPTQFRLIDPAVPGEVILVTDSRTVPWAVTRGAEGAVAAHAAGFTVEQVITAGGLGALPYVPSVFGRKGPVTAQAGDYTAAQTGAAPAVMVTQAQRVTTTSDLSTQVLAATTPPAFAQVLAAGPGDVIVDPDETYQPVLGFGAALTDAACYVLSNYLTANARTALLTELFSPSQGAFSMIRIAFGWQSFSHLSTVSTYDDMPSGQTDSGLVNFSVLPDTSLIVPVLQQILAINPGIRIVASVWTPPTWMLSSGTAGNSGETLSSTYFTAYAAYITAAVQAYQNYGIPVWAVAPENEPITQTYLNMHSADQASVIQALGPALRAAGLSTKILVLDDAWANSAVAQSVLATAAALPWIWGAAWHGYAGSPTVMSDTRNAYPSVAQLATEWRSLAAEPAALQMQGWAGGYVAGSLRNWAQGVMGWNLALDQNGAPNQASTGRLGVVTVNNSTGVVTRNAAYYALRHASAFAQPGARRCYSTSYGVPYAAYTTYPSAVTTAAMVNPDSSVVLYAYNGSGAAQTFQVVDRRTGQGFPVTMVAGELSTFTWGTAVQSVPSQPAAITTAPAAPVLTATGGAGQVALSWTAPSSMAPVDWYLIARGTASGAETPLVQVPAGVTSYTDLAGTAGTWYYTVTAVSAGGKGPASTERSAVTTAATAPAAPVIAASSVSLAVNLAWTPPAANGAVITSYNILRGTTSGSEAQIATAPQGSSGYQDTTGTTGTNYFYKVQAVNGAGTSASSNEVSAAPAGLLLDAVTPAPGPSSQVNSISWSHTVGSGLHRVLLVWVGFANPSGSVSVASVTYGSQSLTRWSGADASAGSGTDRAVDLWYLIAPASGAGTITVSVNGTVNVLGVSASYSGASQSAPLRTAATYANASSTAPSAATTGGAATDLVLAGLHARVSTAVTAGGGQTSLAGIDATGSTNNWLEVTSQPGGTGTVTSSFSWTTADMAAMVAAALVTG